MSLKRILILMFVTSVLGAFGSGVNKVIVDNVGKPWVTRPLFGRSDLEHVFEPGVELVAKKGEFHGLHDSLLSFKLCTNVVIRGGVFRMHKADYQDLPYNRAEWKLRCCLRTDVQGGI